jgi:beta-phosphoglucomutase
MQAVLFDFDGVVVRSMEDHYEGWRKALEEYGIEMSPEEVYIMEGAGVEELASQFTRKFNLPVEETPRIIQKKQIYYDQIKKIEFYPYLIDVFEWIKEKNLKTGLVTGGESDRVFDALENYGLLGRFEVIVTGNDVQHTKPSPEPYLRAARLLDVEPAECIVIENAPLGIQSAKNAGMPCIAVATTLSPMYLKLADVVADNLEQVLEILKKMY